MVGKIFWYPLFSILMKLHKDERTRLRNKKSYEDLIFERSLNVLVAFEMKLEGREIILKVLFDRRNCTEERGEAREIATILIKRMS